MPITAGPIDISNGASATEHRRRLTNSSARFAGRPAAEETRGKHAPGRSTKRGEPGKGGPRRPTGPLRSLFFPHVDNIFEPVKHLRPSPMRLPFHRSRASRSTSRISTNADRVRSLAREYDLPSGSVGGFVSSDDLDIFNRRVRRRRLRWMSVVEKSARSSARHENGPRRPVSRKHASFTRSVQPGTVLARNIFLFRYARTPSTEEVRDIMRERVRKARERSYGRGDRGGRGGRR